MAYADFIDKTTSEKTVLIEMDLGLTQTGWYNYDAGVWAHKWSVTDELHNIGDGNIGDYNIGEGDRRVQISIGSCFVDADEYTEQANVANCVNNEKSWYYDDTNYIFYVHIDNGHEPQIHSVTIGMTIGMSNRGGYYNDLYYEPRVLSVPDIERTKDPLFFGIIRFDSGSFSLINNDGYFDTITSYIIFGQPVRILFGGDDLDYSDFETVCKGYIEDLNLNYETADFTIIDSRKKLSKVLPVNTFNKATYSNLDDDDIGKAIPIGYGEIYHAPVICINKAQSGTPNWTFKVCDTSDHSNGIQSIDAIYVDGVSKSITSSSLTDGTVTIANGDWDGQAEVTVDFKGLKDDSDNYLTNPLDIIKDILSVYADVTYNSTNYNTTEWETSETHDLANDIGLFVDEETEISELIEMICTSVLGYFIVQSDGKYTFRILDTSEDVQRTIHIEEMLGPPEISWTGTQYLDECKIGYKRNWSSNSHRWYVNDTNKDTIYNKYKKHSNKSFETLLVNLDDAIEYSNTIMDYYSEVKGIYTVTTKTQNIQLDILRTLSIEINRVGKKWLDYVKTEIIGVTKDLIENKIKITARHISGLTVFFLGGVLLQLMLINML